MNYNVITWDSILTDMENITQVLEKPDFIIALARGGLIPATLLAYRFKTNKIIYITPELYDPKNNKKNEKIKIKYDLNKQDISRLNNAGQVLIVDDILDSGETLLDIHEYLKETLFWYDKINFVNFTIAKYNHKFYDFKNEKLKKIYLNTFSLNVLNKRDWVVFPWDIEYKIELQNNQEKLAKLIDFDEYDKGTKNGS